MGEENDKEIKLNLRLPEELHAAYTQRAKANRRSLNSELLTVLERFADSPELGFSIDEIETILSGLTKGKEKTNPPKYEPAKDGAFLTGKLNSKAPEIRKKKTS